MNLLSQKDSEFQKFRKNKNSPGVKAFNQFKNLLWRLAIITVLVIVGIAAAPFILNWLRVLFEAVNWAA
jgi:hypothetical protein